MKTKVAVTSDGEWVAPHFGHSPAYTIAEIEDGRLVGTTVVPNPGHRPGFLPEFLADMGVTCVITGGMGPSAQEIFSAHGVQVIMGVEGRVSEAIAAYMDGTLRSQPSLCDHGHAGHHCDH